MCRPPLHTVLNRVNVVFVFSWPLYIIFAFYRLKKMYSKWIDQQPPCRLQAVLMSREILIYSLILNLDLTFACGSTLVCDADVFEMEIINTLNVTLLLLMICKNDGKCGKWHFIINCVRLEFFSISFFSFFLFFLFLSCRKCLKGKGYTNPRQCLGFA